MKVDLVSQTQRKKCVAYGTPIFRVFISSASQIMTERNYYQSNGANAPFQLQVQVFISNNMPWHRYSSKLVKS